jgi:hypothetical protein
MYNGAMSHAVPNPHPHINQSRFKWELTSGRDRVMRHSKTGKTAYFQLKNVIFNTNTIMESRTEYREDSPNSLPP